MRVRLGFLLFAFVAPLLGACATPPTTSFPELTFRHKTPIRLAVGPVAPGPAAVRWAQDVLQATGGPDKLVMVITDASVTETPLKVKKGLKGAFTTDQTERYESRISVRLEIRTPENKRRAVAEAFATRSATIAEDSTLADRETLWYGLTERLLGEFDTAIRPQVTAHLGEFLR